MNLIKRDFKHWRSLGFKRPLTHPAAIVVAIDANDLKQPDVAAKPDAIALVQAHDGSCFELIAALPVQDGGFVRHERSAAQVRECRPAL